jgi:hypothetical protein
LAGAAVDVPTDHPLFGALKTFLAADQRQMTARTKIIGLLVIAVLGGLAGSGQEWAGQLLIWAFLGVFAVSVIFLLLFPPRF